MMLNDLSDCVLACAVPVEIKRYHPPPVVKGRAKGKAIAENFRVLLTVQPLSQKELMRLPEGERSQGRVKVWAAQRLVTAEASECQMADRFEYRCVEYQIDKENDWKDLGGYYKYEAVRLGQ